MKGHRLASIAPYTHLADNAGVRTTNMFSMKIEINATANSSLAELSRGGLAL
jgi:hypothetical protein